MTKIIKKTILPYKGKVFDLEVENNPSYNVSGVIVHNSAAGSLVTYLLGITKVNPLKYNLLFERFLNKGRLYRETSKEIIKLTGTDNLDIELDSNAKCVIFRSNKKITVYARDLQEDDELISYK